MSETKIKVGTRVRLRDGREGRVKALEGSQVVVTDAEDGSEITAPATEAEPVDSGAEGEGEDKATT